jgi:putative membrane protein
LTIVAVFGAGCAVGLLMFSRVLRVLLAKYHAPTMALLCGFMIGSLRRIWPFKIPAADYPPGTDYKDMHFYNTLPSIDMEFWIIATLFIAALTFVFVVDRIAMGKKMDSDEAQALNPEPIRAAHR